MDSLLVIKWQWPNGASFWSTHNDIGVDGRIRDWPGLRLTPTWARRLELGAGDDNLLATIRKAGGDLLSSASDNDEIGFDEAKAGLLKASENGVDLSQGGNLAGLSHGALLSMRAWILHWQRDHECGLKPTAGSLADALSEVEAALNAEGK